MYKSKQSPKIDVQEAQALQLLKSCPKMCTFKHISQQDKEAVWTFRSMLINNARRPLQFSTANFPKPSCDEIAILQMIEAAQSGNESKLEYCVEWLVPHWAKQQILALTQNVAEVFEIYGMRLSNRSQNIPARRETPGLYEVIGSQTKNYVA